MVIPWENNYIMIIILYRLSPYRESKFAIDTQIEMGIVVLVPLRYSQYVQKYTINTGSACHVNLDHHLDVEQYRKILKYAAEVGCKYFTFNIPNSECDDCGYITKVPIKQCPKCGSEKISYYDRVK